MSEPTVKAAESLAMKGNGSTKKAASASTAKATTTPGASGDSKHLAMLKCCPKHLQLPMFLSKTYHMIEKCDGELATWSESGDNFVVKNVELFAKSILPMYFKHSNFSSFARQLNFYGFRKLRMDPILTSDVDVNTTCHVRFFHEYFQRGKPELLQNIKRATKGDPQSKDDITALRQEIGKLKESLQTTTAEYDRKLAELSYECNRRITSMNAEYDKLAALVQNALGANLAAGAAAGLAGGGNLLANLALPATAGLSLLGGNAAAATQIGQLAARADLLHSLSQAAVCLGDGANNSNSKKKKRAAAKKADSSSEDESEEDDGKKRRRKD